MATLYSDIHEIALSKINDYSLLQYLEHTRETLLDTYLISAVSKFNKDCAFDLTKRNNILKQFDEDLDDECKEILALGEVYYWLSPKILNEDILRNNLSSKEFVSFSPANLIRELNELKKSIKDDFRRAIIEYSYNANELSSLGK